MVIGNDVKTDVSANVKAGMAILRDDYKAASKSGGSATRIAQETYSRYNGGGRQSGRYAEPAPQGARFADARDMHFIDNYNAIGDH